MRIKIKWHDKELEIDENRNETTIKHSWKDILQFIEGVCNKFEDTK